MSRENHTRVLVVDDNADAADSMAMRLALWGYASKTCYRCRALAQGFDHYLAKPVELDYLQGLLSGVAGAVNGATLAGARRQIGTVSAATSASLIDSLWSCPGIS